MSDENLRQLRVLHIVSAGGVSGALQQTLFMPLLTRMPKARVKAQVVCLSPGAVPSAVLRQNGVPVHDAALSRQRFSARGFQDVLQAAKLFRPDVIQAWGHTAQIISGAVRKRCEWKPKLVWSIADTAPLARDAGFIDRQKLKFAAKYSKKADRIVYTSEAGASQHSRAGFPEAGRLSISPGVDAARFKSDAAARHKVREQLQLSPQAFVVGMVAPFQPEYDYTTLLKALGELIKTNPELAVVLAGHGVQKGNAPLMALVGGGALGTRTHLLGAWSDVASLFNACDVVCSSALSDNSRMTLAMAMLCGVPCVATGMGAQGEVLGQFGVAIEPGSPAAFVKGITRIMQLTPERRAHMVQGARKHALKDFVYVRSLQKYLQLYFDLIGRESLATEVVAAPEVQASAPVNAPVREEVEAPKVDAVAVRKPVVEMTDPDSLEAKVDERSPETLPRWRIEQEQKRAEQDAQTTPAANSEGDVLEIFESSIASPDAGSARPTVGGDAEDDFGDLLAPEALESDAPVVQRMPTGPKPVRSDSAPAASKQDAADRMRAAAREELKRAAAAMSAPVAMSTPVKKAAPQPAPAEEPEFQLELLPDPDPLPKRASG